MTVKISRLGENRMIVFIPDRYGSRVDDLCRLVHGCRKDKNRRGWSYPLQWQLCLEIRKYIVNPLGETIQLSPEMQIWAKEEKAWQDSLPNLLETTAVPLPRTERNNPKLFKALMNRPFQTRSVLFSAMARRQLIAHDPGLGKTLQAIGAMEEGDVTGLVLVIAPTTAVYVTWPSELAQWAPEDYFFIIGSHLKEAERRSGLQDMQLWSEANPTKRLWILANPYYIRAEVEIDDYGKYVRTESGAKLVSVILPEMFQIEWSGIVVDESHQTLAVSSGNAKKWSLQRVGLGALKTRDDAIRLSISGTPMRGKPANLFGQLHWLRPEIYTSYWRWVERYFEVFKDPGDPTARQMGDLIDEQGFYEESAFVMNRVTKEQVAADLPPKRYGGTHLDPADENSVFGVWLPMTGKQKNAYNKFVKEFEVALNEDHVMRGSHAFTMMARAKQFAGSYLRFEGFTKKMEYNPELDEMEEMDDKPIYIPELPSNKFDWILQFLIDRDLAEASYRNYRAKGQSKVIIASQFTKLVNLFSEELFKKGVSNYVITGETSVSRRQEVVESFQNNPESPKVLLLNTKAGGTALTLDAADDVIIVDETFIPDDQLQVEDRAHRLSRIDHQVTIWYLRSLGTIEEGIGATTTERERQCRAILDGSRGLDMSKILIPG